MEKKPVNWLAISSERAVKGGFSNFKRQSKQAIFCDRFSGAPRVLKRGKEEKTASDLACGRSIG